jgi:hypothetical protein
METNIEKFIEQSVKEKEERPIRLFNPTCMDFKKAHRLKSIEATEEYTRIDFIYGTICCILVILYYQQTEIEGFGMKETKPKKKKEEEEVIVDDGTNLPLEEGFETFDPPIITIDQFNAVKDEFIKEKCKKGILMYKDFPVKSEMADHVYGEIKYNGKNKCNPCDRTCDYNIIEAKQETEKKLIPKMSNDLVANIFRLSESFEPFLQNVVNYTKI